MNPTERAAWRIGMGIIVAITLALAYYGGLPDSYILGLAVFIIFAAALVDALPH